jgi:hypothetical protein
VQLFDYYYGVLCLRVLAFCIQLHMVAFAATSGSHIENLSNLAGPEERLSTLEYHSSDSVYKIFNNPAIAAAPGTLPLSKHESYFLQRVMWDDRKALFEVSMKMKISGWGLIMSSIWLQLCSDQDKIKKYMQFKSTLFETCLTHLSHDLTSRDSKIWYQTSDLICRHYLGAAEDAFPFAAQICGMIDTCLKLAGKAPDDVHKPVATDLKDLPAFRHALTQRLRDRADRRLSPRLSATLIIFNFHYAYHIGLDSLDGEFWPLVEAMFDRLWEEIEAGAYLTSVDARKDLLALTSGVYRSLETSLS